MRKSISVITVIVALFLLSPTFLLAGANETPGKRGRPHKFGCFLANTYEFGLADLAIFKKYVVQDQHYAFGSRYEDTHLDASFGGGGIWNFFEFCSDNKNDVMLVTSHGDNIPTTLVVRYKYTTAGKTARDAQYNYYKNIFAPGTIMKWDYRNWGYSIEVTQSFYTTYFMTPEAMAWWATCWSASLNMTGVAEARAFLGYDNTVLGSKCNCDQEKILSKMDGQHGQQYRPLKKAAAGINGICTQGVAKLVIKGKQNTVLSPSVTQNAPTGQVCVPTPGFIQFDTTMDTSVDPSVAVRCYGDGTLISQAWSGDDKLTFTVVPSSIPALILYAGKETYCRSKANHARLDGNVLPQVNAKGPNRDDYIWLTYCPATQPSRPSTPSTPAPPSTPSTPGGSTRLSTPISNGTGTTTTVTVTMTDGNGWCAQGPQTMILAPDGVGVIYWDFEIPVGAVGGDVDSYTIEITSDSGFPPFVTNGQLVVDAPLTAHLVGNRRTKPGYMNELEMRLENQSDLDVNLVNLAVAGEPGWTVQPLATTSYVLQAGESVLCGFQVDVPAGLPQGEMHWLQVTGEIDGAPADIASLQVSVGLPLTVEINDIIDLVPAKADAIMDLEIHSFDPSPLVVDYLVSDSNGLTVTVDANPNLDPMAIQPAVVHLTVPQDQSLVGMTGDILLTITELASGMEMTESLAYVIEDPIEILGTDGPANAVYTGGPPNQDFPWDFTLHNRCDLDLSGEMLLTCQLCSPVPLPFFAPAGGDVSVTSMLTIPEDHPAGTEPVLLDLATDQPVGDRQLELELRVNTPVTTSLIRRGWSGEAGDVVTLRAEVRNLRSDQAMNVDYQWLESRDWLETPAFGSLVLAPMAVDTLAADFLLAPTHKAFADSDSVSVVVSMFYDSGQPATTQTGTWLMVNYTASGVDDIPLPSVTGLENNYPNPFNPQTRIKFYLAESGRVKLTVHDLAGRLVARIHEGQLESGYHNRVWDGRDMAGSAAASGVYFIRLETRNGVWTRKAVLIR